MNNEKIRILHLASFNGNIGDNANHSGARSRLRRHFGHGVQLEFTDLEIRHFYNVWNDRQFDESFLDLANTFDMLLVGGGNYFELWVENSRTGTTIDLPPAMLDRLRIPTVFYALGLDTCKGCSAVTLSRFKEFLDHVFCHERFLVSVRNDGSIETARHFLGEEYASRLYKVPDGGFFVEADDSAHPEFIGYDKSIVLNLAGDMLERRFASTGADTVTSDSFICSLAKLMERVLNKHKDLALVLVPHIHRDIPIIGELMGQMNDKLARSRVRIAPYLNGPGSERYIFDLYRKATVTLGNRFHANVCPIGLEVPSIGLVNYPKIQALYQDLNMPERAVDMLASNCFDRIDALLNETLEHPEPIRLRYRDLVRELSLQLDVFQTFLRDWFYRIR